MQGEGALTGSSSRIKRMNRSTKIRGRRNLGGEGFDLPGSSRREERLRGTLDERNGGLRLEGPGNVRLALGKEEERTPPSPTAGVAFRARCLEEKRKWKREYARLLSSSGWLVRWLCLPRTEDGRAGPVRLSLRGFRKRTTSFSRGFVGFS